MTDVVEIANERSDALAAEIDTLAAEVGKLEDFIRMAETLLKHSQLETDKASAADGNGAESEHEDLPVRELKAGEQVGNSRTIHNEPSPDRPRGLGLFRRGPTQASRTPVSASGQRSADHDRKAGPGS